MPPTSTPDVPTIPTTNVTMTDDDQARSPKRPRDNDGVDMPSPTRRALETTIGATEYETPDETIDLDPGWLNEMDDEPVPQMEMTEAKVCAGKKKEMDAMKEFDIFEVVPKSSVNWDKYMSSRWELVMKLKDGEWICRARYVLRQYKRSTYVEGIFATASSGITSKLIDILAARTGFPTMTADASNAFWHVPIKEECYTDPPPEWLEQRRAAGMDTDVLWKAKKEWYGRRIAPTSWVEWLAQQLKDLNYERCILAPWFFVNHRTQTGIEVHMDDLYAFGPGINLHKLCDDLKLRMKITTEIHGVNSTFEHLKWTSLRSDKGIFIYPSHKYIDAIVKTLGLEDANGSPTPMVKSHGNMMDDSALQLCGDGFVPQQRTRRCSFLST